MLTPQIMDVELWKQSGHYEYYGDAMFFTEAEGRQFAVKPMNCPGACLVFSTRLRSYRDLPLRFADFGRLHRAERSGVITGLTRVRTFCQDDAHIFCTEDHIESEVMSVVGRIREIYQVFGFGEVGGRALDPAGEGGRHGGDLGARAGDAALACSRSTASRSRPTPARAPSTRPRSTSR